MSFDSVVWYLPNLLNYFRVFLMILICYTIKNRPVLTLALVLASGILDDFDGSLSRQTNQTSKLGAIMDIGMDRLTTAIQLFFLASVWPKFYFIFMLILFTTMFTDFTGVVAFQYSTQVLEKTGGIIIEAVASQPWFNFNFWPFIWYSSDVFYWMLYFASFIPRQKDGSDESSNTYTSKTIPIYLPASLVKPNASFYLLLRAKFACLLDIFDSISSFIELQSKNYSRLERLLHKIRLRCIVKVLGLVCCFGALMKFYGDLSRGCNDIISIVQSDNQLKEFG